jgi:hypothetical protein
MFRTSETARIARDTRRMTGVDIAEAPSYLSFDFASRSDFRTLF